MKKIENAIDMRENGVLVAGIGVKGASWGCYIGSQYVLVHGYLGVEKWEDLPGQ